MTAPVQSADLGVNETPSSVMDDVLSAALGQSLVEGGTPEGDLLRGADGRFKPRDGEEDPTEATPALDGTPVPPTAPAKDGEAVVLPVADTSKLATQFTLKDATGELATPDGLMVEFNANGKTRLEPLDKVVKLAQMGYYQADRVQRMTQIEAQSEEIRSYASTLEERLQTREAQLTQLLSDPDYRARAEAEYAAQQTPEKKAERLQRELEESRLEQERGPIRQQGQQYFQREVLPSLDMITKAMPNVTNAELGQKLHGFVNRLIDRRTGLVPPSQYPQIEAFFRDELIPWARWTDHARADANGTPRTPPADAAALEKAKKDAEDANVRAQRARRSTTTTLRPAGNRSARTAPATKAPVTADEILEDVIQSTKSATFGQG